ncbi:hypothetical protein FACS1894139_18110 [Planctomycetales bacterium]|nr:hypothetical protein FACS1894139_18110 [Planctomycetales bacterium]
MIFHCAVKVVSRSTGRSAPASAAYRAGEKITNERDGVTHDFTAKRGITHTEIILPKDELPITRSELWNLAERTETRGNSTVAREREIALPSELSEADRLQLARDFSAELIKRYGVAVDLCIHAPSQTGDERNFHAHILTTTRKFENGKLTDKTRVLDSKATGSNEVTAMRKFLADRCNAFAFASGLTERVDARSLAAQGIDRPATKHLGKRDTQRERRGKATVRGNFNREIKVVKKMSENLEHRKATLAEMAVLTETLNRKEAELATLANEIAPPMPPIAPPNNCRQNWLNATTVAAENGDADALEKLRRRAFAIAKERAADYRGNGRIEATTKAHCGEIIYRVNDEIVRDNRDNFSVTATASSATLAMTLKIARQRFGECLSLTGDDEFKRQCVEAAVAANLKITFADAELEARRLALLADKKSEKPRLENLITANEKSAIFDQLRRRGQQNIRAAAEKRERQEAERTRERERREIELKAERSRGGRSR